MPEPTTLYAYVFHRLEPDLRVEHPARPEDFQIVAPLLHDGTVEDALALAFSTTVSREQSWTVEIGRPPKPRGSLHNQTAGSGQRSTMTGDLLIIGNSVWRRHSDGWERSVDTNAVDFLCTIPEPETFLHGIARALAEKYQLPLSFDYLGNTWSDGTDDRLFSVFYTGPRPSQWPSISRWGRFGTNDLPRMAKRAETMFHGKRLIEHWAEALKQGDYPKSEKFCWGNIPQNL